LGRLPPFSNFGIIFYFPLFCPKMADNVPGIKEVR